MKPSLEEGDPITAVVKELDGLVVRLGTVTRTTLDTVHFTVGTRERWMHLGHEGIVWIRNHQHSRERKQALLAAAILLGADEIWSPHPIATASSVKLKLEANLAVVAGDAVYLSTCQPGRVTTLKPYIPIQVGVVLDATMYRADESAICRIVDLGVEE